jgi:hypothetical protein
MAMADTTIVFTGSANSNTGSAGAFTTTLPDFTPGYTVDGTYIPADAVLTGVSFQLQTSITETAISVTNSTGSSETAGIYYVFDDALNSDTGSSEQIFVNKTLGQGADSAVVLYSTDPSYYQYTGLTAATTSAAFLNSADDITVPANSTVAGTLPVNNPSYTTPLVSLPSTYFSGYTSSTPSTFSIGGNARLLFSSDVNGTQLAVNVTGTPVITATVEYSYTEPTAPEPATMVLFGSALVGLGVLRRRSRKA